MSLEEEEESLSLALVDLLELDTLYFDFLCSFLEGLLEAFVLVFGLLLSFFFFFLACCFSWMGALDGVLSSVSVSLGDR